MILFHSLLHRLNLSATRQIPPESSDDLLIRSRFFGRLFFVSVIPPWILILLSVVGSLLGFAGPGLYLTVLSLALIWTFVAIPSLKRWCSSVSKPITQLTAHFDQLRGIDELAKARVPLRTHDNMGRLARSVQSSEDRLSRQFAQWSSTSRKILAVMNSMTDVIIAVDSDRHLVFANRAGETLFNFEAERHVGRSVLQIVRDRALEQAIDDCLQRGEVVRAEMVTNEPKRRHLSIRATSFREVSSKGVLLVLHDITELRRLENLRQEFVANVSHELKTPLSSIKAYAETLKLGAIDDPQNNMNFVNQIEIQADRLHRLILDMLQIARVESGQEAFEVTDVRLDRLMQQCQKNHNPAALAKEIDLSIQTPQENAIVRADEDAVRTILDNLVVNAITYTPRGKQVSIACRCEEDSVVIEVADKGIGISTQDQTRIFERFYRVDRARSRELGGTGLGLSIVKHLCQAFDGTVSVESQPGVGSTFRVRLPKSEHP
jgi:two-component system, OmpR family, phosphate regulon sensor histidine kinase PhoR